MKTAWRILPTFTLFAVSLSADTVETIFFRADLSTANQVPPVTGVSASGRATIAAHVRRNDAGEVVSGVVDFDVDYTFGSSVTVNGLHIHNGAAGTNGPVFIDSRIGPGNAITAQGSGNIFRQVNVDSGAALDALKGMLVNPADYYVNLHTSVNPDGLIRDQTRVAPPPAPAIAEGGVLNNAGYALSSATLAPGTIVAIFGNRLTDGTSCLPPSCNPEFGSDGKLKTTMAGAQVMVNGIPAPILYALRTQLGVQLPFELTGTSATVQVTVAGQTSPARTISIGPFGPGIFTVGGDGKGAGAITHANGSLVTPQNPARPGEVLIVYATGLGPVTPAVPTGALPTGPATTVARPAVTIDGVAAEVQFSGMSGCCVGLNQLNVVVPAGSRSAGDLSIVISASGIQANPATLAVGSLPPPPPSASNPVPAITGLSPAALEAGDPAQTLTINGTGFMAASTVAFNGAPKAVTFVSETRLTIPLTAGDLQRAGSYAIVVTNPPPGGGTSNVFNLTVLAPPPPPPYPPPYGDY